MRLTKPTKHLHIAGNITAYTLVEIFVKLTILIHTQYKHNGIEVNVLDGKDSDMPMSSSM
jgi:hypothetical protein